jgi:hypothetical protein
MRAYGSLDSIRSLHPGIVWITIAGGYAVQNADWQPEAFRALGVQREIGRQDLAAKARRFAEVTSEVDCG